MHRNLALLAATLVLAAAGCATTGTDHLKTDSPRAQLFEGMGAHTRAVTTSSPEAQEYFGQGLAWMYAFNHDEAIRSFARAAELDPGCAMAWWGIALCEGPNYNDPVMTDERSAAAWGALQEALARMTPEQRAQYQRQMKAAQANMTPDQIKEDLKLKAQMRAHQQRQQQQQQQQPQQPKKKITFQ